MGQLTNVIGSLANGFAALTNAFASNQPAERSCTVEEVTEGSSKLVIHSSRLQPFLLPGAMQQLTQRPGITVAELTNGMEDMALVIRQPSQLQPYLRPGVTMQQLTNEVSSSAIVVRRPPPTA